MPNNNQNTIQYHEKSYYFLKASSLSNTIFICLLISLFCGCLVLIAHYQNMLIDRLEFRATIIDTNNQAFNYYLAKTVASSSEGSEAFDVLDNGILSTVEAKPWGYYNVLTCSSIFKNDTVIKSALIGKRRQTKNNINLFVTDYDRPLKVSGKTTLEGVLKVPKGRVESSYLASGIKNTIALSKTIQHSDKHLPRLSKRVDFNLTNYKSVVIENYRDKKIINSFDKAPLKVDLASIPELETFVFKGNLILVSEQSVTIPGSAKINDVLVIAPSVTIQSGFEGNMQILAKKEVVIESNALLKYPSSIYAENDADSLKIHLKKDSKLFGGLVLAGDGYNSSLKNQLIIDEDALVVGSVYCYGRTQLQGKIIGRLYTDRFFVETKSAEYDNQILNATVTDKGMPRDFIDIDLFDLNSAKYDVVKAF